MPSRTDPLAAAIARGSFGTTVIGNRAATRDHRVLVLAVDALANPKRVYGVGYLGTDVFDVPKGSYLVLLRRKTRTVRRPRTKSR